MVVKSKQKGNTIYHKTELGGVIKHPKSKWCMLCDNWVDY